MFRRMDIKKIEKGKNNTKVSKCSILVLKTKTSHSLKKSTKKIKNSHSLSSKTPMNGKTKIQTRKIQIYIHIHIHVSTEKRTFVGIDTNGLDA